MFFTPAPPPTKVEKENEAPPVGRYEENFEEKKTLNNIVKVLIKANENEEINIEDPLKYTYFIFGVLQGNIIEGFEYSQRIISNEIKNGIIRSEEGWKIFRKEIEKDYDKLLLDEINQCLSMHQ